MSAGTFIDCLLYITFFPKIASGPIVKWKEFLPEIRHREITSERLLSGFNRIAVGLAKKAILADSFGACVSEITAQMAVGIDMASAWLSCFLYMLQIYFDFSGYSDIAIGLAKLLGFEFGENFHFPYLSTSITEFWRRWHISLGSWFREYIYIPLGGNRKGQMRTMVNLGIVFLFTGIWHGAGISYLLWGCINGFFVIVERFMCAKPFYKRIPGFLKWFCCMLVVMLSWELFRFGSISGVYNWLLVALGIVKYENVFLTYRYFLDARMVTLIISGIVGSTLFGFPIIAKLLQKLHMAAFIVLKEVVMLLMLAASFLFVVNQTYSPFLYFQF